MAAPPSGGFSLNHTIDTRTSTNVPSLFTLGFNLLVRHWRLLLSFAIIVGNLSHLTFLAIPKLNLRSFLGLRRRFILHIIY